MLLKARRVLPVSSPSVENAAVVVERDRIAFVGTLEELPQRYRSRTPIDLANAILLPGLVNAHCHLEHSALKGMTTPGLPFTEWVREVARESAALTKGDLRAGVGHAVDSLISGGTTTVADHASPEAEAAGDAPLRRVVFWEVLGAHRGRAGKSLEGARRRAAENGGEPTPHSLYAVHEEVLEDLFRAGARRLSIHLLESSDEEEFFRRQTGPLAVYVQERGGDLSFPLSSPVEWLARVGAWRAKPLLVHGNHLNDAEIAALRGTGAFVIHCPGSHRFFGHRRFPLEALKAAGVPVALGTDSLASNEDLSMLREMRLLRKACPDLEEAEILRMATIEGARALGMESEIGSIDVGKKADLIAVGMEIFEADRALFSMIDGKVIFKDV